MDWQEEIVSVYLQICNAYNRILRHHICRFSNNSDLSFSDEEVMTIYINGTLLRHGNIKDIYDYTDRHLRDWFPALPSYFAFVQRLNNLSHLFEVLVGMLQRKLPKSLYNINFARVIDSMPIILAHRGRRFKAKVAPEIATKNGYCATKKLHYYGVKLHVLASYQQGSLPVPEEFGITEAGVSDIRVYERLAEDFPAGTRVFADKAYQTQNKPVADKATHTLFTPVKKAKGQEKLDSADKLLSSAISTVRQPIESFFNWIEQKTKIQIASKVRSYNGLMVHVFGKLAAAFFLINRNFESNF